MDKALRVRQTLIAFLDRDGVISRYYANDFTNKWEEFEFLPGAKEALRLLHQAGAKVIIISNQSGVNKGIYSRLTLKEIDRRMRAEITRAGGEITASYYCPHTAEEKCSCRKPGTGLIEQAVRKLKLNLEKSSVYFVGDSDTDIAAGKSAGLVTILVLSGKTILAEEVSGWPVKPDHIAPDLLGALKYIL